MFGKKLFFTVAVVASLFSDSAFAKKSHSKRHPKSIAPNPSETPAPQYDERGLEVVDVDLRSLGLTDEQLQLFDHEFVKRSSLSATTVSVPEGLKKKKGGIGSWYHTDSTTDSTNGKSWCGFEYNDATPGFAISLNLMGGSNALWGDDTELWQKATNTFCGLQAELSYQGKTVTAYIADGFDPQWVRTKYSIDIIYNTFTELWGEETDDKDDVMIPVKWKLTGKKAVAYTTHN